MDTLAGLLNAGDAGNWGLLLVGIDHLGRMNDTFGFGVADQIVSEIAQRLQVFSDSTDLIARYSGSKFAFLACSRNTQAELEALAADISDAIWERPIQTEVGPLPVSVTLGGLSGAPVGTTPATVMTNVKDAHDLAKRTARGSFQMYKRDVAAEKRQRANQKIAGKIVKAIWDGRVSLALQPVVHIRTREPVFHEVLVRISPAPAEGLRDATHIISAAERLGLMGLLDRHILGLATQALRRHPELHLSVNVSPSSLADRAWLKLFASEVSQDIGPRLIMELTESAVVHDLDAVGAFVAQAHACGARVAIDDFGAGSTSFRNLRALGVDIVKIDGSFVVNMRKSADDRAFVYALIQLARQLNIQTVAEWVQNEQTAAALAEVGCDYIQGALTGMAVPYEAPLPQ